MECLDDQTLLDFLAGRLAGDATARAREHVARCDVCNMIATEMIRGAASQIAGAPRARGYELVPGHVIAEKYRLLHALGEGGMGVVWAAESRDGARVAIKLLKAFDVAAKRRFLREIAITSALVHPGLVRVVEVLEDVEAGCPALVVELLEGASLADRLREVGRLEPREARGVARRLARTLGAVHAAGLVHRDVKPANVFLLPDASRPVVLLDLGLAKAMSGAAPTTRITRTGHAAGTPAYMAPEQLAGEAAIDARADLWSLGVMLYECILGERPFAGRTVADVLRSALRGLPSAADRVDPPTRALLRSLLAPDRAERPASADVVADLLARIDPDR
jgi:serine/threonine-protein kinase